MSSQPSMAVGGVDNDTRGWIMCLVSGIACVLGASIICVDLVVRLIPGKRNFKIQDSNTFLSCSLSLSFGVMLFSALYSMLPSSKRYLLKAEIGDQAAGLIMMAGFAGGFIGIGIVSRIMHRFMPSHVVDCDHTHDPEALEVRSRSVSRSLSRSNSRRASRRRSSLPAAPRISPIEEAQVDGATEHTPLLRGGGGADEGINGRPGPTPHGEASTASDGIVALARSRTVGRGEGAAARRAGSRLRALTASARRPSFQVMQERVMSFVKDTKNNCDNYGPCFGYTDPCGQECFKHLGSRAAVHSHDHDHPRGRQHSVWATRTNHPNFQTTTMQHPDPFARGAHSPDADSDTSHCSPHYQRSRACSRDRGPHDETDDTLAEDDSHEHSHDLDAVSDKEAHHHHVPANAFMSIGLQTVIAIALHKFPEGFITYATNHANPALGLQVFAALFVHNIAEGFAMALPLYMALGSRMRAMAWSALLGGASQPLGAAAAWLWFRVAQRRNHGMEEGGVGYAVLFAATAGIMTSVALQLFVESLSLNHNRNMGIVFAFLGMALMGVTSAFTADKH